MKILILAAILVISSSCAERRFCKLYTVEIIGSFKQTDVRVCSNYIEDISYGDK